MDSAVFMEKQNFLVHELCEARQKKTRLLGKNGRRKEIARTEQLIGVLKNEEGMLTKFDERRFDLMVDTIRIEKNHAVTFCLKNHMEFTEGGNGDAVAHTNRVSG
ncbi:MAG: hypothetical protein PHX08_08765 [Lachnospiraceae bacterium]|nr:hypothetical protein [Lachnospiraceae bacterium]